MNFKPLPLLAIAALLSGVTEASAQKKEMDTVSMIRGRAFRTSRKVMTATFWSGASTLRKGTEPFMSGI